MHSDQPSHILIYIIYPSVISTTIDYTFIVLKIRHNDFKETTCTKLDFTYKEVINIWWLRNIFSSHKLQTPFNRNISVSNWLLKLVLYGYLWRWQYIWNEVHATEFKFYICTLHSNNIPDAYSKHISHISVIVVVWKIKCSTV